MTLDRISRILLYSLALAAAAFAPLPATGENAPSVQDGWAKFRMGEFNAAISIFKKLSDIAEKGGRTDVEALYGLACSYDFRQPDPDRAKAAELYRRIADKHPEGRFAAWCELALVRQTHTASTDQEPDYEALREAYRKVYERHPSELAGQEAFIHMQATRLVGNSKQEAQELLPELDEFQKRHTDSKFISQIWTLRGVCHDILEDDDAMLKDRVEALKAKELDPLNPFKNNAGDYWSIATLAEFSVGDLETAKDYYAKLVEEYPTNFNAFAAKEALKRIARIEKGLANGEKFQQETLK